MTKFRSFSSALAAGVVGSLLWMGSASAQLITVQVQEDAGPVQVFTNGGAGPVTFATTTPSFTVAAAAGGTATGPSAGTLGSTVLNVTSTGSASPLFVTVTQSGNVTPAGFPAIQFTSGLTWNPTVGTQTTTLSTLFNATTLASATSSVGDFVGDVDVLANPGGAFSVTNRYEINAPTASQAQYTIGLTAVAVPGPVAGAALPALLGLAGFYFFRRRRDA
jgi:hypothetical protein